ncbi:MAG: topoisomerase DNA-binding C4 zinc finger domain-containing protein, partial [Candidatus Methylumidiphilus sp.]
PKFKHDLQVLFPNFDINNITVHAAKGKEADYVIILGMEKGKFGFPSEMESDALLEFLLPENEPFMFAEERRLFYVALTRARHRVYLVYNPLMTSKFIKELIKGEEYPICTDEFDETMLDSAIEDVLCPVCKEGSLIPKTNRKNGSLFVGCNNYPYCKYTERPCPRCNGLMQRQGRFKVCTDNNCKEMQPICPKCGAVMVQRQSHYGPFWGCINYRRNSDFVCNHTENRIEFPA